MNFSSEEKEFLLQTSKKSISNLFGYNYSLANNFSSLEKERSCFVTLKSFGTQLRGCIGSIIPNKTLFEDVKENSYKAAFQDPRFSTLSENEINEDHDFNIEISILTYPQRKKFESIKNLIYYLEKNKPGLIIKKGDYQATFLPKVWDDLKDTETFLNHLISKAGYESNYFWLNPLSWEYFEYYSNTFCKNWHNIEI